MSDDVLTAELRPVRRGLSGSVRAHLGLLGLMLAYAGLVVGIGHYVHRPEQISLMVYSPVLMLPLILCGSILVLGYFLYVMVFVRPERLFLRVALDVRERMINSIPIFVGFQIFFSAFTSFKTLIPVLQPFRWDPTFAAWDQTIHGIHPWLMLQPLVGNPITTAIINFFYTVWFFVLAATFLWQALSLRDPRLRMQFFIALVLCWSVLGSLVAALLSSAGPCYFGAVVPGAPDPFAPLMDYLRETSRVVPVWALDAQAMLWAGYVEKGVGIGTGISAMPSIHVSCAVLFAILGWRTRRALGIALTAFATLILIGSVHLGWHYAVDGYVAIVGTLALWRLAEFLTRLFWPSDGPLAAK
jgi:hypothetical protein